MDIETNIYYGDGCIFIHRPWLLQQRDGNMFGI